MCDLTLLQYCFTAHKYWCINISEGLEWWAAARVDPMRVRAHDVHDLFTAKASREAADRERCAFAGRSLVSWGCPNDRTFLLTESTCTVAGWFTKRNICSHQRITDVRTTPGNYSLNEKCVCLSAWETSLGLWSKGVDGDYVNKNMAMWGMRTLS